MVLSKTKSSFYRRLLIASLIERGFNTIPKIMSEIEIPRRTAQDTISALEELDIECAFIGAPKNGYYEIRSWGAIDKSWVMNNTVKLMEHLAINFKTYIPFLTFHFKQRCSKFI